MKYRVKYYSLVEMLLVISIITVLCGLVLAAVMVGREKSRTVNCLSNVSQMNSAFQGYSDDNKKVVSVMIKNNLSWTDQILKPIAAGAEGEGYIAKKVATCPSDRVGLLHYASDTGNSNRKNYFNGLSVSIPTDTDMMGTYTDGNTLRIRRVKRPSETIYYGDTGSTEKNAAYFTFETNSGTALINRRHKNLANVLYFDGHAKSLNKDELAGSINKITKTYASDYRVE